MPQPHAPYSRATAGELHVLVIDPGPLLRRGVVATLDRTEGIGRVDEAGSLQHAWEHAALSEVDVVVLDGGLPGAGAFVAELDGFVDARVLALTGADPPLPGATSVSRDDVTPRELVAAVLATGHGHPLVVACAAGPLARAHRPGTEELDLTAREREVLRLVADGLPTREVALELAYSERTVKKVLGDAVAKLGGRTRAQAIAVAARRGII